MLLALDIGNTNITMGLFDGAELRHTWRLATDPTKTGDEYSLMVQGLLARAGYLVQHVDGCVVANVVPALSAAFTQVCRDLFQLQPLFVDATVDTGVEVQVDFPKEVGADRIVNAAAAYRLYGGPAIVIDFGTATTFDVISGEGAYIGGAIAPGVAVAAEALAARAARLFRVELVVPERAIGKNTVQSLQSGLMYGYIGLVEGLVRRLAAELEGEPVVIATGGLAETVARHTQAIDVVNRELTLQGLHLIYARHTAAE